MFVVVVVVLCHVNRNNAETILNYILNVTGLGHKYDRMKFLRKRINCKVNEKKNRTVCQTEN